MRQTLKWLLGAAGILFVLVAGAVIAVPFLVDTPGMQAYVAATASQALGRPVKFSGLSVRVVPLPAVELRDLEVAEDPKFGTAPFLRLERGHIRLQFWPLLSGRVELGDIVLRKPTVAIVQAADGRLNIASLGGAAEPRPAARPGRGSGSGSGAAGAALTNRVVIDDGQVTYSARGPAERISQYRLEGLDLTLTSGTSQITFKGDARLQPGAVALKVSDGVVSLGPSRSLTDAPVRAKVTLDGKDIHALTAVAVGPSPEIGGALKGTLTVGGTAAAPTAAGEIQISNLTATQSSPQCSEPRQRTLTIPTLTLNAGWQSPRFTGKPLTATLGGGTIGAQLTATLDRGAHVQLADLVIKALPLEKVLVDYLCEGYAVTGPLDLTGAPTFQTRDVLNTLNGPGQLRVGRGKVVGPRALALVNQVARVGGALSAVLGSDIPSGTPDSPLEFESITGTYTVANGVVSTRDLLYTTRAMKVLVAGDYGLGNGAVNLDLTINHKRGDLKAKVTGTAASPSVRVSTSSILKSLDNEKTEKGLRDFLKRFKM
jgi:AsmA protein